VHGITVRRRGNRIVLSHVFMGCQQGRRISLLAKPAVAHNRVEEMLGRAVEEPLAALLENP
jgi:hypothetical protein